MKKKYLILSRKLRLTLENAIVHLVYHDLSQSQRAFKKILYTYYMMTVNLLSSFSCASMIQ